MSNRPYFTKHASKRIAQRVGSGGGMTKIVKRAYKEGIPHSETIGELHDFMTRLYLSQKKGNNMRVYGDCVYIFDKRCLVTVIKIPYDIIIRKNEFIKSHINDTQIIKKEV